jgi:hypothetical protein
MIGGLLTGILIFCYALSAIITGLLFKITREASTSSNTEATTIHSKEPG